MPQIRVIGQCICDLANGIRWISFYEKLQTKSFYQIGGQFKVVISTTLGRRTGAKARKGTAQFGSPEQFTQGRLRRPQEGCGCS